MRATIAPPAERSPEHIIVPEWREREQRNLPCRRKRKPSVAFAAQINSLSVFFHKPPTHRTHRTRPVQEKKRPKPRKTARVDGGDVAKRSDGEAAAAAGGGGRKRSRAPSWERDYQQIWKAVTDLGSEQFTGKEKKAYEARKIVERGGRVGGGGLDC